MTDKIFLLSVEEYEKYKDKIPWVNCCWWLRSPGGSSNLASVVVDFGSAYKYGHYVYYGCDAVRPAIVIPESHMVGERLLVYDFPWIVIDEGLAIAEVPIGIEKFDKESNDYENSEIRRWLLNWIEWRK